MKRRAFTLIELLVVVAILTLLIGLLLPSLLQSRARAREAVCASNLRQVAVGIYNYWTEFNGRVPYVETPMTNGGFGDASIPDEQLDPFDRQRWPLSLPNVLMPKYVGQEPRVFACPSALNAWPRGENSANRFSYRDAGANQVNGVVEPPGSYVRESFGFMDGRMLRKLRVDWHTNPTTPRQMIENAQAEGMQRGTYLRDLIAPRERDGDAVLGPHRRGIHVLDRDMQVRFRSQKTATEDLAPGNVGGVRF